MTGFHRLQSGSPLVFTTGADVAQVSTLSAGGQYAALVPGATADDMRRGHSGTEDMIAQYFSTSAFVGRIVRVALKLIWPSPHRKDATSQTSRRGVVAVGHQNVAIGFTGEPVPPRIASGATVSRNSHRFRFCAASASASRSTLSKMCTPR